MRGAEEKRELAAIVRRFADRTVAVVGDVVVDEYIYGQTDRISREAPVLIVRHESTERKLGGAANAAANLASLGGRTILVGAIGDDEAGRGLVDLCGQAAIDGRFVTVPGRHTETKTRILAGGINTTRQQMLRVDRSLGGTFPPAVVEELVERLRAAAREAEVLVVSDYGGGVLCEETIAEVRRLSASGVRVCVDSRYNLCAFAGVYVAKPNEPELGAATGMPVGDLAASVAAAKVLRETLDCHAVLATRGRSGMALVERGKDPDPIPVYGEEEAVDVTGAGDTVIATLAMALAADATLGQAARIANVAGALVVRKPGTATVSAAELLEELEA